MKTNLTLLPDVVQVLQDVTIEATELRLPGTRLDRALYLRVAEALEALGSRWDRKRQAHLFSECPKADLQAAIDAGFVTDRRKLLQFYLTPPHLAADMAERLVARGCRRLLEPSAGDGAIAAPLDRGRPRDSTLSLVEKDESLYHVLVDRFLDAEGVTIQHGDFLKHDGEPYDGIAMNPPFAGGQDADHIHHALNRLTSRGSLIAIASAGLVFRKDARYAGLRLRLDSLHADIQELPDNTFAESGTCVRTVLVIVAP